MRYGLIRLESFLEDGDYTKMDSLQQNLYKDFIAAQQSEDKRIKIDLVPADEERRASRIVIFD